MFKFDRCFDNSRTDMNVAETLPWPYFRQGRTIPKSIPNRQKSTNSRPEPGPEPQPHPNFDQLIEIRSKLIKN